MPRRFAPVFDGVDDDIAVADHSSIQNLFATGGAIGIWAEMDGTSDANPTLAAKSDVSTKGWYCYLADATATTGSVVFGCFFSGTTGIWAANSIIDYTLPNKHRWWVSYDASSVSNQPVFYCDGAVVSTLVLSTPTGTVASDVGSGMAIGSIFPTIGLQAFKGKLWDFCMKSSTISAADALKDWQENHLADSAFVARYKLNETNFPTDNAANSGSGGAGTGSAIGCVSENGYARFA